MTVLLKLDLHVKPGKRDEILEVRQQRFVQDPTIDGYHKGARIAGNPDDPNHILVVETWDTQQHEEWVSSAREAIDTKVMPSNGRLGCAWRC